MTTFTGADLVAKALADLGVRHVFAIVSIHNMPLLDAINRLGKTAIVDVRHEGAGTHAADGYARATGELGIMIASTGPGTSNTVTGLYEAQYGSSRVLVITGQAETAFYGRGVGYVHEAEKQIPMLESVCRRVESPRHSSQLGPCLQLLVNDMFTGRPAPGALEIPIDLQYAETPEQTFSVPSVELDTPDQEQTSAAAIITVFLGAILPSFSQLTGCYCRILMKAIHRTSQICAEGGQRESPDCWSSSICRK